MAKTDADWLTIDATTLSPELAEAYAQYKASYKLMKEARQAFEQSMADGAGLAEGKRLIFGYNFGKLSIAVVEDDRKPAKAKNQTLSLSAFLERQEASGHRA